MKNKNQKIIITKRIAMNIYLATHTDVNLLFHEAGHYFISVDTHRETHTHIQRDTQCTSCFAAKSMGKFNRALRCARNLLACWLVSIYCSFTVFECVCVFAHQFFWLFRVHRFDEGKRSKCSSETSVSGYTNTHILFKLISHIICLLKKSKDNSISDSEDLRSVRCVFARMSAFSAVEPSQVA